MEVRRVDARAARIDATELSLVVEEKVLGILSTQRRGAIFDQRDHFVASISTGRNDKRAELRRNGVNDEIGHRLNRSRLGNRLDRRTRRHFVVGKIVDLIGRNRSRTVRRRRRKIRPERTAAGRIVVFGRRRRRSNADAVQQVGTNDRAFVAAAIGDRIRRSRREFRARFRIAFLVFNQNFPFQLRGTRQRVIFFARMRTERTGEQTVAEHFHQILRHSSLTGIAKRRRTKCFVFASTNTDLQ